MGGGNWGKNQKNAHKIRPEKGSNFEKLMQEKKCINEQRWKTKKKEFQGKRHKSQGGREHKREARRGDSEEGSRPKKQHSQGGKV